MVAVPLEPTPPPATALVAGCPGLACGGCGAQLTCQQVTPQAWAWTHHAPTTGCRELLVPFEPVLYLLHLHPAYQHARHYLGFTDDLPTRLARHAAGRGSPLLKAALAAGGSFELTRLVWPASQTLERRLKNRKYAPRLCPRCTPTPLHPRPIQGALDLFGGDHDAC